MQKKNFEQKKYINTTIIIQDHPVGRIVLPNINGFFLFIALKKKKPYILYSSYTFANLQSNPALLYIYIYIDLSRV